MAATGAPKPRFDHLLAWTGDRLLVWGGGEQGLPDPTLGLSAKQRLNDGGLYDPVAADAHPALGGLARMVSPGIADLRREPIPDPCDISTHLALTWPGSSLRGHALHGGIR